MQDELFKKIASYNPKELDRVKMAFEVARMMHNGQYRESGEPYIIHPLNVTYILANMHADGDTLCAGMLHDTLEDTNLTYEDLRAIFGESVAMLVEGVTNFNKEDFRNRKDRDSADTRKIIQGVTKDARIIIIKLADRLHNMRTLGYKNSEKQIEKSIETMEIFIPLAYYLGINDVKSELEDICLSYLKPEEYKRCLDLKREVEKEYGHILEEMIFKIKGLLELKGIPNDIRIRIKNAYGIYKRLILKNRETHDMVALKIMIDEIDNCYLALGQIHRLYRPVNDKFKDYISSPKDNMYSSLHTTVFAPNEQLVQLQIRTPKMDNIATHGLPYYWYLNKGNGKFIMQREMSSNSPLFEVVREFDGRFISDEEFVNQIKSTLFGDKVYVYYDDGKRVGLKMGSTVNDFIVDFSIRIEDIAVILINDEVVPSDYVLKNNDRIRVIKKIKDYSLTRSKENIGCKNN